MEQQPLQIQEKHSAEQPAVVIPQIPRKSDPKIIANILCKDDGEALRAVITNAEKYCDEIYLSDGGSKPETLNVIDEFSERYKNIKLISHPQTTYTDRSIFKKHEYVEKGGYAQATRRNALHKISDCDWILLQDTDDLFTGDIRRLAKIGLEKGLLAFCNAYYEIVTPTIVFNGLSSWQNNVYHKTVNYRHCYPRLYRAIDDIYHKGDSVYEGIWVRSLGARLGEGPEMAGPLEHGSDFANFHYKFYFSRLYWDHDWVDRLRILGNLACSHPEEEPIMRAWALKGNPGKEEFFRMTELYFKELDGILAAGNANEMDLFRMKLKENEEFFKTN